MPCTISSTHSHQNFALSIQSSDHAGKKDLDSSQIIAKSIRTVENTADNFVKNQPIDVAKSQGGAAEIAPKLLKFPSIEQFSHAKKIISSLCKTHKLATQPILKFVGTVKIHGTNAAVVHHYGGEGKTWCQSRNKIINTEYKQDNMDFAKYATSPEQEKLFSHIFSDAKSFLKKNEDRVAIYGEWCGEAIQKGVAISELSRRFVVFAIAAYDQEDKCRWLNSDEMQQLINPHRGKTEFNALPIYTKEDFHSEEITIDFSREESLAQASARFEEITQRVEKQCPVAAGFGVKGIGEGMVWTCTDGAESPFHNLSFKTKGALHRETTGGSSAPVDIAKYENADRFIACAVNENRLNSAIDKLAERKIAITENNVMKFTNILISDVFREERYAIKENKFDSKILKQKIEETAKHWYSERIAAGETAEA